MYYDFDWTGAPLSWQGTPVLAGVAYLASIAFLPRFVPPGGVRGLEPVFVAHNLLLSGWSLLMFCGCLWEMYSRVQSTGNKDWLVCEVPGSGKGTGPLYFWSYIFYVSKYYEMVDTWLALLKGSRPPHFGLHVYHHALVPVMVWNWLEYRTSTQFPGLLFNTFVHVVMYAYYALKVLGKPIPWKRWVTRLQIIQFVTSLVVVATLLRYTKGELISSACAGTTSLWMNIAFNMTLLWQFVGVLFSSAPRRQEGKKAM